MQMQDFSENAEGIEVGDRVKVTADDITFHHLNAYKEGFNPAGCEGEVKKIKLWSEKHQKEITANRPVMVAFTEPVKFMAHFEFGEVSKV